VAVVGRNGAGKSTLLRILTGLVRADAGTVAILGHAVPDCVADAAPFVGSLVDRPGFLGGLSGHANLEIVARRHGLSGRAVHDVLDRCEITTEARRRVVSTYSLGMRQRLGLAAALLGDPPLLILDEPTNGLDPAGITWVREVVRGCVDAGGAVLLASHLLGEVEAICDDVVVLRNGSAVHAGTMAQLLATVSVPLRVRVTGPAEAARRSLASAGIEAEVVRDGELAVAADPAERARLSLVLAADGIAVTALEPATNPLEVLLQEPGP
jgi:ABC-2 type transport system ATP-binding protein